MLTVYKYPLGPGQTSIMIPKDAKVLSVAVQHETDLVLYALVDLTEQPEARDFYVVGTGHPINLNLSHELLGEFLGTVRVDGWMFWHVFEVTS